MAVRFNRSRPAWLVSAGLVVVAGLVLAAAFVLSGEPDPEIIQAVPVRDPQPEPEPEPEPEPPPPVEGHIAAVEVDDLSATGSRLFHEGSGDDQPVPFDDDAVEEFVAAMVAWLDAHLTDLQDDGPGLIEGLAGDAERVAGALASSDAPVAAATYEFRLGTRGAPEWGYATVSIQRGRGVTQQAVYTFLPGEQAILVAAETLPIVVDPPKGSKNAFSAPDGGTGA